MLARYNSIRCGLGFLWIGLLLTYGLSPARAQPLSPIQIGVDPTYNRFELEYLEPQLHKWY